MDTPKPHPTCPLDHTPNKQTIKALQDASEGHRLTNYDSFEDWMAAILADGEDDSGDD